MIQLKADIEISAPADRCFDLARSVELHADSAQAIRGRAVAGYVRGLADAGHWTTWSARFFGVRFHLTTHITDFDRPHGFSDIMREGLFSHFGHRYTFQALSPERTQMTDEFRFESPCGPLGALFDRIVLSRPMQTTLQSRALCIKRVAESDAWQRYLPPDEDGTILAK